MGTATSSFEAGPPSFDLDRPVLFYEDLVTEGKVKLEEEPQITPLGKKLLLLYITNQLPAADLFWANSLRGNTPKQFQFFALLGQLYELFITPHTLAIPPHQKSCSYLKLFEAYSRKNLYQYIKHVLTICRLNVPNVVVYPRAVLVKVNFQNTKKTVIPKEFEVAVRMFKQQQLKNASTTLIIPLVFMEQNEEQSHIVYLAIKRNLDNIQFVYIDPHGFDYNSTHYKTQRFLRALLQVQLNNLLYIPVTEVVLDCPSLQRSEQGGNCVQWFCYNMFLFLSDPNIDLHLQKLKNMREVTMNIHLFEIAMFLKTIPYVPLKAYYNTLFKNNVYTDLQNDCQNEFVYATSMHLGNLDVTNCLGATTCDESCAHCKDTCNFPSAVFNLQDGDCLPLSPKLIGKKMLLLYAELRKIAQQDPSVMAPERIEEQLDFEDAQTVEDYKRLYNLTDTTFNTLTKK